jgi:signal peptidase II
MIGGALGNGFDRLSHGHVVDFIQLWFLPILNAADLFFLFGTIVVAWDVTRIHPFDQGELHASDPV